MSKFSKLTDQQLATATRDAYSRFVGLAKELRTRGFIVELEPVYSVSETGDFEPDTKDDVLIYKSVTL